MSNNPEGSSGVKVCPSCKSPNWNITPKMVRCKVCGTVYLSQKKGTGCPNCSGKDRGMAKRYSCGFCNATWVSDSEAPAVCPKCGLPINRSSSDELVGSVTLWNGQSFKLAYTDLYDYGCVYLWNENYLETSVGIEKLLKINHITLTELIRRISDRRYDEFWWGIAAHMHEHRNDYLEYIPYFEQKLGLDAANSEILALHFIGFSPEAIAIRLGRPIKEIRQEFDRIMKAYLDNGIIVNDSIYTEDPIALYNSEN